MENKQKRKSMSIVNDGLVVDFNRVEYSKGVNVMGLYQGDVRVGGMVLDEYKLSVVHKGEHNILYTIKKR